MRNITPRVHFVDDIYCQERPSDNWSRIPNYEETSNLYSSLSRNFEPLANRLAGINFSSVSDVTTPASAYYRPVYASTIF